MKKTISLILITSFLSSAEITSISKSSFIKNGKEFNMLGKNYIVIELNPKKSGTGNFYAFDKDSTLWLTGPITAGSQKYRTSDGIFSINYKKRYHMSSKYPQASGINNMNYSMFFNGGIALHQGSVKSMSHGCIHVHRDDVPSLFRWADRKTKIIVTRDIFRPYVSQDILDIGLEKKWKY